MGSRLGEDGDFNPEEIALATLGGRLEVGVPARDGRERLTVPMSVSSSMVYFRNALTCLRLASPQRRRDEDQSCGRAGANGGDSRHPPW